MLIVKSLPSQKKQARRPVVVHTPQWRPLGLVNRQTFSV